MSSNFLVVFSRQNFKLKVGFCLRAGAAASSAISATSATAGSPTLSWYTYQNECCPAAIQSVKRLRLKPPPPTPECTRGFPTSRCSQCQ
ncbi:hypothetical protein B0H21DRAFT_818945 [Amylocystis lapponica]|nr:hypothetical protein B0H21DRAFT_818945 [Amylocystis lapponica]